jgi:hypothetical protein
LFLLEVTSFSIKFLLCIDVFSDHPGKRPGHGLESGPPTLKGNTMARVKSLFKQKLNRKKSFKQKLSRKITVSLLP